MLSCKDASRLESQAQDRRLHFGERLGLRMHLLVCAGCREFARQLRTLRQACQHLEQGVADMATAPLLSTDAKVRIAQRLAARLKEKS